jgi:histidine racemase
MLGVQIPSVTLMKTKQLTIAGGNNTILIWGCPVGEQNKIAKFYLSKVEQVGFIDETCKSACLSMMGDELCINGTLAIASQLSNNKKLFASGITKNINYINKDKLTSIVIELPYFRDNNRIIFQSIGYIISTKDQSIKTSLLIQLANKYRLPAYGQIVIKGDLIQPYVYVKKTNSLVAETACGSGSIAYSIFSDLTKIKQPTGQYIVVEKNSSQTFKVSAEVIRKGGEKYE